MNLSVISKKAIQYPVPFVCAVIIPVFIVLLVMRGPKASIYEEQLPNLERDWTQIQENVVRSAHLEEDIEVLDEGLKTIRSRLMKVEDVALNYEFFYHLESQAGVILKQFSQGTATDGKGLPTGHDALRHFSVIPYDLSMEGTLPQILKFMDLLDRQNHIIRLDRLSLIRKVENNPDDKLLNARLWCYVLAEKDE